VTRIHLLPNLITLGNAFCGLLALAYAIDALALSGRDASIFYRKLELACFLIFLAMVLDAMDGLVARLTQSSSELGAQLDSFSDALTFGVVPAMLAKVLIEHEGPQLGYQGSPRLHYLAAAAFALMAILRLARFNLENEPDDDAHTHFKGLPSPAAAGAVASTIWLYLVLRRPELEVDAGVMTPFGKLMSWMEHLNWAPLLSHVPLVLALMLPALGLLLVSRVRYAHFVSFLVRDRHPFFVLVAIVFCGFLLYLAPVPVLFATFNGFALAGVIRALVAWMAARNAALRGRQPVR